MADIDINAAAEKLGLSARRVRALAGSHDLPARKVGARWIFDSNLVQQLAGRSSKRRIGGRPFSPQHALGALFLASDEPAPWLSAYEEWRLRRYALPRLRQILPRLSSRAEVGHFVAPESALARLRRDARFIRSGVSAAARYGAPIVAPDVVDGYFPNDAAEEFIYRNALRKVPEASANLILRSRVPDLEFGDAKEMPVAVVAADLADSSDMRTRRAGSWLLGRLRDRSQR